MVYVQGDLTGKSTGDGANASLVGKDGGVLFLSEPVELPEPAASGGGGRGHCRDCGVTDPYLFLVLGEGGIASVAKGAVAKARSYSAQAAGVRREALLASPNMFVGVSR